jgi:hypothetical protein
MHSNGTRWLTAQQTAIQLDTTSSEVCRLISLGRLSGTKQKDPVGPANRSGWLTRSPSSKKRNSARQSSCAGPATSSASPLET